MVMRSSHEVTAKFRQSQLFVTPVAALGIVRMGVTTPCNYTMYKLALLRILTSHIGKGRNAEGYRKFLGNVYHILAVYYICTHTFCYCVWWCLPGWFWLPVWIDWGWQQSGPRHMWPHPQGTQLCPEAWWGCVCANMCISSKTIFHTIW